jgi:hypothetical protein
MDYISNMDTKENKNVVLEFATNHPYLLLAVVVVLVIIIIFLAWKAFAPGSSSAEKKPKKISDTELTDLIDSIHEKQRIKQDD